MAWRDRPYATQDESGGHSPWGDSHIRLGLPRPTHGVLGIIIACFALFLLGALSSPLQDVLFRWLSFQADALWQIWRIVTFQFLHAGVGHFLWNMLGLYFFGPPLERLWGTRRFVTFYLVCGAAGAMCFLVIAAVGLNWHLASLVGASGGILGCLMACAILFPGMLVLIFPIRWVAAFLVVLYVLRIVAERERSLSDAAHLGGMIGAAGWIHASRRWGRSGRSGLLARAGIRRQGAWQRKMARRQQQQAQIDAILEKIHQHGLKSLTWREKRLLKRATEEQRAEEQRLRRM